MTTWVILPAACWIYRCCSGCGEGLSCLWAARSLENLKASSLCRSNPSAQFGGGAAAGARNEGLFPGQVPHGRPRVRGPKETGRSVVSRVAVDRVPVCFCSPARGGRCYPVVTSWVSMEHWLWGSQVSKARPGAPFAFFRHGTFRPIMYGLKPGRSPFQRVLLRVKKASGEEQKSRRME
jgi:hypothetical protein